MRPPEYARGRLEHAGVVVFENIDVLLHVNAGTAGEGSWYGSFTAPSPHSLEPGMYCDLVLEDGRRGRILITGGDPFRFTGFGRLQRWPS